jgi:hypothetical protein
VHEHPDYDKLDTLDGCDKLIQEHKDILVRKDKTEFQIKASKKDAVAAHNEQLKELNEERQHEIGVIDALMDRKRVLAGGGTVSIIPLPTKALASS